MSIKPFYTPDFKQATSISRNTINLWLQRKAETGDVLPLPNHPPGNNHKITDWDEFRAFAKSHGDKTQLKMAQLWEGDISDGYAGSLATIAQSHEG